MKRALTLLVSLSLLPLMAAPLRGDDWLQFRHDATRSAISADKLQFPLKELWSWNTASAKRHSPLFHSVVRQGWVYFTASDKSGRHLICANARTGVVKWQQPLQAETLEFCISDITGPAVTESGRVFVYDWVYLRDRATVRALATALLEQYSKLKSSDPITAISYKGIVTQYLSGLASQNGNQESVDCFAVRTFDADTGKEGSYFPLAFMGANGVLPRLSLVETRDGQEVHPVPPGLIGCPP